MEKNPENPQHTEASRPRALLVGDTLWFKEEDMEVRFKDLGLDDALDWLDAVHTEDIVNRTVVGKTLVRVPGQYGPEPATVLVLDDGTIAVFVHPGN